MFHGARASMRAHNTLKLLGAGNMLTKACVTPGLRHDVLL